MDPKTPSSMRWNLSTAMTEDVPKDPVKKNPADKQGVTKSNLEEKQKSTNLAAKVKNTPVQKDLPDFSNEIDSPTAQAFKKEVIDKNYTYGMSTDPELKKKGSTGKGLKGESEIDCSGAVCKVLKAKGLDRGDPTSGNNAQKLHDDAEPVPINQMQDGDLITFKVDGDSIDHIGFVVIDKTTGEKFIAESSRSFNQARIVPFKQRIKYLEQAAAKKGRRLEYYIRRLSKDNI